MPAIIKTKAGWSELEGIPILDRNQPSRGFARRPHEVVLPKGWLLVFVRKNPRKRG